MASLDARNINAEAARLEAIAQGAGEALACVHESAEDLHRSLVRDYLQRKQKRGMFARALGFFSL